MSDLLWIINNRFQIFKENKNLHKIILVEKEPHFSTYELKKNAFYGVSNHIFIMRHPYSIHCGWEVNSYCKDGSVPQCVKYFVKTWLKIFKQIQHDNTAMVICYEGYIHDFHGIDFTTIQKQRRLEHHGILLDVKYMWTRKTKESFKRCKDDINCKTFIEKYNIFHSFCGYDLKKKEIGFKEKGKNGLLSSNGLDFTTMTDFLNDVNNSF